jgi:hypothetical protein
MFNLQYTYTRNSVKRHLLVDKRRPRVLSLRGLEILLHGRGGERPLDRSNDSDDIEENGLWQTHPK